MADYQRGTEIFCRQQYLQRTHHSGKRGIQAHEALREAVPWKIHREGVEARGEKREESGPGMRRGAGPVEQQDVLPLPRALHVPAGRGRINEAAMRAVRPVPAVCFPVQSLGHGRYSSSRLRTSRETRAASARGKGR